MRITNGMIRQTTLNGLQNSMTKLNKTFAQMSSGKKIQTVSDDPIIAGRALKLKTNVLENDQYKSNTKEATAWAETTATSLENITKLLNTIRDKCVEGATGTMNEENKNAIKTQIEQNWQQILQEINNTYAGRFIFTGYKTSEPMAITDLKGYTLEKDLTMKGNIWVGDPSTIKSGSTLAAGSEISKGSVLSKGDTINGNFKLGADTVISEEDFLTLTGYTKAPAMDNNNQPILDANGKQTYTYTLANSVTIAPKTELTVEEVTNLESILTNGGQNTLLDTTGKQPTNADGTPKESILGMNTEDYKEATYTLGENESYTIPAGTAINEADFKKWFGFEETVTPDGEAGTWIHLTKTTEVESTSYDLKQILYVGTGCKFEGEITVNGDKTALSTNSTIAKDSRLAKDTHLGKGTLNPKVIGNIDNHKMAYEIGVNNTVIVNAEGMDTVISDMVKQFNEIFNIMDNALKDDTVTVTELNEIFSKKIEEVDKMINDVGEVTSNLGSRINRLTYVESNLTDQRVIYKNLLTQTEDIEAEETYTNFSVEYAAYQSALQATIRVVMNTLADYL